MKIKYLSHSGFLIDDLVVDPFLTGNENAPVKPGDVACRVVCITHDHKDHIGDAFNIAKTNKATVVAVHEIAVEAEKKKLAAEGMNMGGNIEVAGWKIKMIQAVHSSSLGSPAGFVLEKDGKKIYHAGDTALFTSMSFLEADDIDIALLPIGGRYTMDVEDALIAITLIKPKLVIPMHYNTFPEIKVDPNELKDDSPVPVKILKPGQETEV